MGILVGLPGVKGDLKVQGVTSPAHAIRRIQYRRAVTAAGSSGAINVWRDDRRRLRSHFMRYHRTMNEVEHASLESLCVWLKIWWPQMGRSDAEAPARGKRWSVA